MKRYLYLLPAFTIVSICHYQVITGYIAYKATGDIFAINSLCAAVVVFFWLMISIYGIFKFIGL